MFWRMRLKVTARKIEVGLKRRIGKMKQNKNSLYLLGLRREHVLRSGLQSNKVSLRSLFTCRYQKKTKSPGHQSKESSKSRKQRNYWWKGNRTDSCGIPCWTRKQQILKQCANAPFKKWRKSMKISLYKTARCCTKIKYFGKFDSTKNCPWKTAWGLHSVLAIDRDRKKIWEQTAQSKNPLDREKNGVELRKEK